MQIILGRRGTLWPMLFFYLYIFTGILVPGIACETTGTTLDSLFRSYKSANNIAHVSCYPIKRTGTWYFVLGEGGEQEG